jgi:hypothetical protein
LAWNSTTWFTADPHTIIEFDIAFNTDYAWGTDCGAGHYDVQSIAAHELGHTLQLLDLYGTADTSKMMYGFGDSGVCKRNLHADDEAGISYIYPCSAPGTPSGPSPSDGATDVSVTADLDWADATGATSYDVYFGTSPSPLYDGNTTSSSYSLPTLNDSTHYYWKIVAKNDCGETAGPMWDFTTGANSVPTLGTVDPSSGSGPVGVTTYFTTTWSDADGWEDLKQCYFHVGAGPALAGNVTLMYNAVKNKLWIRSDDGMTWLGGLAPGSANVLDNGQAKVYCSLTTVQGAGNTLSVTWAIEFKPGYIGTKKLGLKCKDRQKAEAKGAWKGTWTIE